MIDLEEIKQYLPKYLSSNSEQKLFEGLKDFPENIDSRLYASKLIDENLIYQGDGLEGLLVINLPDTLIKETASVVLSNTCDMDLNNRRIFSSSICYSPIINLDKYIKKLEARNVSSDKIQQFINILKKQKINQIFFLPKGGKLENDSFIFLNKINHCDNNCIRRDELSRKRLFVLSNYGLYLFLFKLSVHFTRIHEGIDRE